MKTRYAANYDYGTAAVTEFYYEKETEKNYIISGYKNLAGWNYVGSRFSKEKPSFENLRDALEHLRQLVLKAIERTEQDLEKHKKNLQEIENA